MIPLAVPADLPEYTRDYLRQLDDAITKTVHDTKVTAQIYRDTAKLRRSIGRAWEATAADDTADRIERDPRLHVADVMHALTPDGTAKLMLVIYATLLEAQTLARRAEVAA